MILAPYNSAVFARGRSGCMKFASWKVRRARSTTGDLPG